MPEKLAENTQKTEAQAIADKALSLEFLRKHLQFNEPDGENGPTLKLKLASDNQTLFFVAHDGRVVRFSEFMAMFAGSAIREFAEAVAEKIRPHDNLEDDCFVIAHKQGMVTAINGLLREAGVNAKAGIGAQDGTNSSASLG